MEFIFDYFKNFTEKKEPWNKDIYNNESKNIIENNNEIKDSNNIINDIDISNIKKGENDNVIFPNNI